MQPVFLLLAALVAGYIARRLMTDDFDQVLSHWLNRYVIYIALPALVLVYIPRIDPHAAIWVPVASAWGLFVISSLGVIVVGYFARWRREVVGALLFTVPYGNTSFLGVPFTKVFFGDAGLAYTLLYDQLGSFLILSTVGVITLAVYTSSRLSLGRIIRRILFFPAFLALVVSFFLMGVSFPPWIAAPLELLAASLSPVAMIAIGLQLRLRFASHERAPFVTAMLFKLILAPALLLAVFVLLGQKGLAAQVSVFEAGMAPMVSSATMAILAGLNPRFTASVLGYGIVLSFLTLPVLYWVAERML